jgi:hypothetical protein
MRFAHGLWRMALIYCAAINFLYAGFTPTLLCPPHCPARNKSQLHIAGRRRPTPDGFQWLFGGRFFAAGSIRLRTYADTNTGLQMAGQIADAIVMQIEGPGSHWTQSARSFLRGLIQFVCKSESPVDRHLIRVRELLLQPKTLTAHQMREATSPSTAKHSDVSEFGGNTAIR